MYNSQTIAENIKTIAKTKNIQVKSMLISLNMATTTIQNMIKSMPKADTLAKIADYLECSVDYLLGRQVSMPELSENESILLSFFRECSENSQKILLDLAEHYSMQDVTAKEKEKKSV